MGASAGSGLFFQKEKKLSVRRLCIANPVVCPPHSRHDVALVIHLNDMYQSPILLQQPMKLVGRSPASGTIGQDDPACADTLRMARSMASTATKLPVSGFLRNSSNGEAAQLVRRIFPAQSLAK